MSSLNCSANPEWMMRVSASIAALMANPTLGSRRISCHAIVVQNWARVPRSASPLLKKKLVQRRPMRASELLDSK